MKTNYACARREDVAYGGRCIRCAVLKTKCSIVATFAAKTGPEPVPTTKVGASRPKRGQAKASEPRPDSDIEEVPAPQKAIKVSKKPAKDAAPAGRVRARPSVVSCFSLSFDFSPELLPLLDRPYFLGSLCLCRAPFSCHPYSSSSFCALLGFLSSCLLHYRPYFLYGG